MRASLLLLVPCLLAAAVVRTEAATLVLPLRSVGVSDTTCEVSRALLEGGLRDQGVVLVNGAAASNLPSAAAACGDPDCAAAILAERGADQIVYATLGKLGDKVIVRIGALRAGETAPFFSDQLTASVEEDLDAVMRRAAEAIAAGRPNASRATIDSVTQQEAKPPVRRATRSAVAPSAGFLFPSDNAFGGVDRMTTLKLTHRFESRELLVQSTVLAGLAWGDDAIDWTILDVAVSRVMGTGDIASYVGGGVGIHRVGAQKSVTRWVQNPYGEPSLWHDTSRQDEVAPSLDLVAGILALRTYDFELVLDLRYHHVFERLEDIGGGAHGFIVTLGTSR
ncbi:MAG: hypothetical protein U0527_07000 [Candidatus Eisenbacteria bacterium]